MNSRIERWTIELLYNYMTEHKSGVRMKHVDAFSRIQNIGIVEANSLEANLVLRQGKDSKIKELQIRLQSSEDSLYELRNGIVYRKAGDKLLFYVPTVEYQIIHKYHDEFGHVGAEKTCQLISQNYFMPQLNKKLSTMLSTA